MNVLFLDYDGVVNTPMWQLSSKGEMCCNYNFPSDNKVNNFQACQWVSEFCERFNYSIVVTSTWRLHENYINCLYLGGLRDCVKVLGKTPDLRFDENKHREDEIRLYLDNHPEVTNFIIIDDDPIDGFDDHYVCCSQDCGFNFKEYCKAKKLHDLQNSFMTK